MVSPVPRAPVKSLPARYDGEHGTARVTTLRAYVEADYNANETARRLYVHPNTLAYRLRTIRRAARRHPPAGTCA